MSPWMALAWLWLLMAVITLSSGLVMAFVTWGVGARPEEIRFHLGPSVFAFRALGIRWSFSPLAFGTSMSFTPPGSSETPGMDVDNAFTRLSLPRRLIAVASTFLGMILLALVCLPPSRGLAEMASGFEQSVNIVLAPERVIAFFALLGTEGFWPALGVLSAKLAALNLLPLPPLSGFMLLREVWVSLTRSRTQSNRLSSWSVTVMLMLYAGWAFGLYEGLSSLRAHGKAAGDAQGSTLTRDGER